jgi:hypothetical protein
MFIILFLLAGCASTPVKEVVIKTKPIEIEIAQPERPKEIKLERPEWFVVNSSNLQEFLEKVRKIQSDEPVFFAFTPQDYEKMSYNLQEIRRYVLQQNEIIVYYEKMTAPKTTEEKSEELRAEQLEETTEIQEEESPSSFMGRVKGVFNRDETED